MAGFTKYFSFLFTTLFYRYIFYFCCKRSYVPFLVNLSPFMLSCYLYTLHPFLVCCVCRIYICKALQKFIYAQKIIYTSVERLSLESTIKFADVWWNNWKKNSGTRLWLLRELLYIFSNK